MFWFGDLNFRIESLDIRFVKYAIDSNILSQLWEKDQVRGVGMLQGLQWHSAVGQGMSPRCPWGTAGSCSPDPVGKGQRSPRMVFVGAGHISVLGRAGGVWSMDLLLAWHWTNPKSCVGQG